MSRSHTINLMFGFERGNPEVSVLQTLLSKQTNSITLKFLEFVTFIKLITRWVALFSSCLSPLFHFFSPKNFRSVLETFFGTLNHLFLRKGATPFLLVRHVKRKVPHATPSNLLSSFFRFQFFFCWGGWETELF